MRILAALSGALLATAPAAAGQGVLFRGMVERTAGPKVVFFLHGTNTELTSRAVDLASFVGLQVEIGGDWNGSATKPLVDVLAIGAVREMFVIGDKRRLGGDACLTAFGTHGEVALFAVSTQPSFVPVPGSGTLFFDPAEMIFLGAAKMGANGRADCTVPIPYEPALVGAEIYAQAAILRPGAPFLTNPDWMTIGR